MLYFAFKFALQAWWNLHSQHLFDGFRIIYQRITLLKISFKALLKSYLLQLVQSKSNALTSNDAIFSKIVLDDCMWLCSMIMFRGNVSFQRDSTSRWVSVSEWMYLSMQKKVAIECYLRIKIIPEFLQLRMRNFQGIIFISPWVSGEIFKSGIV